MHLQNFSFDFGDVFFEFGNLRFAFRILTTENVYGVDGAKTKVESGDESFRLNCEGFTWAGGQEKCRGTLLVEISRKEGVFEWNVRASHTMTIKAVATIVEGLPAGKFTHDFAKGQGWEMNDVPDGASALVVYPMSLKRSFGDSVLTPLVFLEGRNGEKWFFQSLDDQVRPKRFAAHRRKETLRMELVFEERAEKWKDSIECPPWRIGTCANFRDIASEHTGHLISKFGLTEWDKRTDVPEWLRGLSLVIGMHGAHWTGFVFNNYARQLEILKWFSSKVDPKRVLVYLPGWDGRYHWNYPAYEPDPHMGGDEGFKKLCSAAREMGFHLMPVFSAASVNMTSPFFGRFIEARIRHADGDHAQIDWADWDSDRHLDGWGTLLSLDAKSWRNFLFEKIVRVVERFGVEAIFLDLSSGWTNDPRYDWVDGVRRLIRALHEKFPWLLVAGKGYFDAMLAHTPFVEGSPPAIYPEIFTRFARGTYFLSQGAPGRGSTGVHEAGFIQYERPSPNDPRVPQISIVEDTFDKHSDEIEAVIEVAKEWAQKNNIP